MASKALILLFVTLAGMAIESGAAPTTDTRLPETQEADVIGRMQLARDKRTVYRPYPQRAMLLTGFYRPARHSDEQASGLYAGGAFLGKGPELAHPDEVEPVPEKVGTCPLGERQVSGAITPQVKPETNERRGKKKIAVPTQEEEYEDDTEDEEEEKEVDEEEDSPAVPFIPARPGKGGKLPPSIAQYFPVVFNVPRRGGRRSSGDAAGEEVPGLIAAIANSYSTGKGGVASSVATAYGGSPSKKKRRLTSDK